VAVTPAAVAACTALRRWLASRQLALSDRRWRQWIALMRVAAATEGRDAIDEIDLWLAPFVASPRPELAPELAEWFQRDCLGAVALDAPWLGRAVEAFEKQLDLERNAGADDADDTAGKLALARAMTGSALEGGMPRVVSATLEDRLRRRYSSVHVAARVAQMDEILAQGAQRRAAVADARDALARRTAGRLWLPAALVTAWLQAHAHTLAVLDALMARLATAREGFAALPVDDRLQATAPAPVGWSVSDDGADAATTAGAGGDARLASGRPA
jgi:MoxR-like ATPase